MSDQPTTRQQLYDRIRDSSKDEVIVEEMIRLGFWPADGDRPEDPASVVRRRGELQRELRALRTEQTRLQNVEALKREARQRRLEESRRKRKETRERRLRERAERAEAWRERKQHEIGYLGARVSAGLGDTACDVDRLRTAGLPELGDAAAIAAAMGISIGELRFLAFARDVSRTTHYARFAIPKRTGGERIISAPMPRLKAAQRWILTEVLAKVPVHEAAHGFRPNRSIVTNARPHVGSRVVVNLDLEQFFPTLGYRRVKGVFRKLGYSEHAAILFGLLCTEPEVETVELDGVRYHVALGERRLPQGAPTSPAITNIVCRRLDRRLTATAAKLGYRYTRYADDLTLSARADTPSAPGEVGRLLRRVEHIIADEGFTVHPDKTRIQRHTRRQEVTGVVVNERLGIDRRTLRRFRATLFQIENDGPEGKRWGASDDVIASVHGFASYVAMVNPALGGALLDRTRALVARHGTRPTPPRRTPPSPTPPVPATGAPESTDAPEPEKKKWWKLF